MSNHYHIVVRLDGSGVQHRSDKEVTERWTQLFSKPALIRRHLGNCAHLPFENDQVQILITTTHPIHRIPGDHRFGHSWRFFSTCTKTAK